MTRQHKPGSKADRDALRHEMTQAGCTRAEIAVEMRSRWGMRPREAWRQAAGWSMQEAADQLNALNIARGQAAGADASLVGKWERWPASTGRRPPLGLLALLAELYGGSIEDLIDLDDRRALPPSDLRVLQRTLAPTPSESAPPMAVQVAAPPTPAALVQTAATESVEWAQWAEASNVGEIALEQLLYDTRALAAAYLVEEPLKLFVRTRALRDRTFALLEGHQRPRQSIDLYIAAGYLCALLAWMSSDLGRLREADSQGRTAGLCADLAGHGQLRAWTWSTRSKIALWDGRLRDAVTYARRGASYAPTGSVAVLLASQEADAWSILGAVDEAQRAIGQSLDARDRADGEPDDIGGLFSCPEPRRANYATAVHLRTGQPLRALDEARAGADAHVIAYGTMAQMRIAEASAHLALQQPDGAAEALHDVLALPVERRMMPVTTRMREFGAALSRTAPSQPARALQTAVADFVGSSPRIALSPGDATG